MRGRSSTSDQRLKASKAMAQNEVGTGGPPVGYGTRQTTARSPPRLGRAAHLLRDPWGWTNRGLLSRRPDEVGTQVLPIFEPFGLSSRSCCSTGRLMRSLSPSWWGWRPADLRIPPFFTARTQRAAATSVRVGGGVLGQDRVVRRRLHGPTSTLDPWTQFAINYLLSVIDGLWSLRLAKSWIHERVCTWYVQWYMYMM